MESIMERLRFVRQRIDSAAERAGRPPEEVILMGAVKTRNTGEVLDLIDAGVTCLGENKVQEGEAHLCELPGEVRSKCLFHFIGRLQSNKARKALRLFDSIDSLDSPDLLARMERICEEENLRREVLIEVNLGGENQKGGVDPKDLDALADRVMESGRLTLAGLMAVPPFFEDAEESRPYCVRLRGLFEGLARRFDSTSLRQLSMGMTNDLEVAIEEGATLVRVGTALLGPRRIR